MEPLRERIVAIQGQRLGEALALPHDNASRDAHIEEVLQEGPDGLIAAVVAEAAGLLLLNRRRPR